jgi:hypothetical protein
MTRAPAVTSDPARQQRSAARAVSKPYDASEREADRAADVVARGGSVRGWSFSAVPVSAPVQRQDDGKPKTDEEKKEEEEALAKTGEAVLETEAAKKVKEKVLDDPLVKKVKAAATSSAGLVAGGAAIAGGVGALAATGKELPFQPPAIPLDRITPGLSAQVTYKGPVNAPTDVGLSLTYKEQGPKAKGPKKTATELQREENARLAAEQAAFRRSLTYKPGSREAAEQKAQDEAIARLVAGRYGGLPGFGKPLIPLKGTAKEEAAAPVEEQKKQEDKPVQRAPDTAAPAGQATARVDAAPRLMSTATPGRPLEPAARRTMETRFGYDFSRVRIHDDAQAAWTARSIGASAFTVGESVVFGAGRYDPSSPAGQRLLAHELAHVVQQSSGGASLQRKAEPGVSSPHDAAERAAEEVADRVAAEVTYPDLADDPWPDSESGPEPTSTAGAEPTAPVQAAREGGPSTAPPGVASALASSDGGATVPAGPRRTLERAFGTSFAQVRLHRGQASDRMAGSIGARAFTWGNHVHLSASAAEPTTPAGLWLLAHELAHVQQQAGARGLIQRSRALYFSTHGRQGYFRYAERFHNDHGFPAPVRVSSVEEMLETLVRLPRPLESVRLVTHAVPSGVFLPLLRGGSTSLFERDLALQMQTALEGELATEHPTVRDQVMDLEHHVVPRGWTTSVYARVRQDRAGRDFLAANRFPDTVARGGDLETLLWWILDRVLVTAQRDTPGRRGRRPRMTHVLAGLTATRRAAAAGSLDRNVAVYRELARQHLLLRGIGRPASRDQRLRAATAAVAEFEQRVVASAAGLIDEQLQQGPQRFQVAQPSPRYESIQGALERGTYSNNVLFAKSAIPNAMPFEIRGCRIGQNMGWLEKFRDFWGLGAGATAKRPDVSAPDLRHVFGLRNRRSAEWLEGPRGRQIRGGTPEFDQHIVHAR